MIDGRGKEPINIIDKILEARGIKDVEHFFYPEESDLLPLDALKNVDKACDLLDFALTNDYKISILADTDTDGVCSGTIMYRYLKNYTNNLDIYINDGKAHGLVGQDLSRFDESDLVIITDSLDKTSEQYKELYDLGKNVIILDHHDINPNVDYSSYSTLVSSQDDYKNKNLSGAGVCLKFCLRFDEQTHNEYAEDLYDLAAVGILADVMDISEQAYENRYIVDRGLKNIVNPALKKICGFGFNAKTVLFSVAPLVNAANRMNENDNALKFFLSNDNKEILAYKKILENCKVKQNEIVDELLDREDGVIAQLDEQSEYPVIYAIISTPYGIGGLIGNKVLEQYKRPLFILQDCGDKYMGSMRSVGYENFRSLINSTQLADSNGHESAAGIEIPKENFERFIEEIRNIVSNLEKVETIDATEPDCLIDISDLTEDLAFRAGITNRMSGHGFPPITFRITGVTEYSVEAGKEGKHLYVRPNEDTMLIEWNTNADFESLEKSSYNNDEFMCVGEICKTSWGRKQIIQCIMSSYEVIDL